LLAVAPASAYAADPAPYTRWILAEGAANDFFDEDIVIGNPNAAAATINITLLPEGGTAITIPAFTLPGTSRYTFDVKSHLPSSGGSVSAVVTSTLPVVVERTMTWPNGQRLGGHNSPGVLSTAPTWYLAEGTTGFFDTFILITNPDPAQDAQVDVKYLRQGQTPITQKIVVPKNGRYTIWANDGLDLDNNGSKETILGEPFSTVVSSTNGVNIAVERAMYWNHFKGGHEAAAVTAPNTVWLFAEGATGGSPQFVWDTYILLANPQDTDANVTLTFFRDGGTPLVYKTVVKKNQRDTLRIAEIDIDHDGKPDLANANFSTRVESTNNVAILAERAMYWTSNGVVYIEGHDTPGVNETAPKWAFAEGVEGSIDTTGIRYSSFFLVSNASTTPLELKATFVREDGKGLIKTFIVAPQTRFTLPTGTFPELSHQRFSAFLETTNGVPFVAERAVYWGEGFYGGHASVGTPWTGTFSAPPIINLSPTIVGSLLPNHGLTTGGTDVTITGTNFVEPLNGPNSGTRVKFGSVDATSVQIVSDTRLVATTPAVANPGSVSVTVTNTHINGAWTPAVENNGYKYDPAVPTLETELTLAFGDSITFGTTSRFCDMGGTSIICSTSTTGYPARLESALRARYPQQALISVTNSGVAGECAARAACVTANRSGGRRLLDELPGPHNLVVILEGVNDANLGVSIPEITNALRNMILAAKSQGKKVILSSLTPVKAHEDAPNESPDFWKSSPFRIADLNGAIENLASEQGVPRVNMFAAFNSGPGALDCNNSGSCRGFLSPDGLHPNDAGYQRMANAIFDKIIESFEAR
jgi:lysophospholipase L1-like esterase